MKNNCQSTLCGNCAPEPNAQNELFCSLCRLAAVNMDMDFDDEELADFSTGNSMKQVAKVTFDRNSSKVIGWDSIWSILEEEDKQEKNKDD